MFSWNVTLNQHFVTSMDNAVVSVEGKQNIMGYEQARLEASDSCPSNTGPLNAWDFP